MSALPTSVDTAIVGAGISGLALSYKLHQAGVKTAVFESSERAGGVIRSEWKEGFLLEHGPNTVLPNAEILSLVEDLNLSDEVLFADPKAPRYVQWKGRLYPVPLSPLALARTKLLSLGGRARLLAEPLIPRGKKGHEESLYDFCLRRLGAQATDRLVAPYVSGIWAGDIRQLSAEGAFSKMTRAEREKGSLFRGLLLAKRKDKSPKGLLSFKNGLETLPRALAEKVAPHIFYRSPIKTLKKEGSAWRLEGVGVSCLAQRVIFAQPSAVSAPLVSHLSSVAAQALRDIPSSSLAVLHLSIEEKSVGQNLNGFGYLIAPDEQTEVLGCLWNSSLFPRRVPNAQALLTVFMGGLRHPDSVKKSDEALFDTAFQSLGPILNIQKRPRLLNVTRYEQAIPQYTIGHPKRTETLHDFQKNNPGLFFAGNIIGGISVGDVVKNAVLLAKNFAA